MAKAITRAAARQPTSSAGSWIVLIVGVAVLTVAAVSVPHLIDRAGWATGEKFLYLALLGYLGASVLYILLAALRQANLRAGAAALTRGGFLMHTGAIVVRWATSGHPPLSSIYEMVLVFSWGVVALHEVAEWKFELPLLGAVTLPIAALSLILIQVLPGEIRPLVPALQSTWLQIHVTLAMLSYAGFALSFAVALLYLIKDGVSARGFSSWISGLVLVVYGAIVGSAVDRGLGLSLPAWDVVAQEKIMSAPKQALMVSLPGMGWPFLIVLVLGAATLVLNLVERPQEERGWGRRLFLAVVLTQVLALGLLLVKTASGPYFVPANGQSFDVRLASSPFLLAGIATALFASLACLVLKWKYDTIVAFLPQREMLDTLIYKTVALSFPLLTLMIVTGAYWANRTWGSYWSWDPKETWALITWLTYAGYLHMRLTRGWRGRRSAYFAIIGFAVVLFTFFGVTYLLPGLHSYG